MVYSYYVYYRVEPSRAGACENAVLALLDTMNRTTGISGRLLKKRGEPFLWMEVYENVHDDMTFESRLASAATQAGIDGFLQAGTARRTECFESEPCA